MIDLKGNHFYFSEQEVRSGRKRLLFLLALSAVPHLCYALYVRGTSTEHCVYRCDV